MDIEYRIRCKAVGTDPTHRTHNWPKKTVAKANQSKIDLDHRAEMHPDAYYTNCAPYVVETREVSEWADMEGPS